MASPEQAQILNPLLSPPQMELLALGLLTLWFAATVAYQLFFQRLKPVTARWDLFRVVPSWCLYTEILKSGRLYIRDRDAMGTVGPWKDISPRRSSSAIRSVFNPQLFANDATMSLIEILCDLVQEGTLTNEQLVGTSGWRGVWIRAAAEPGFIEGTHRQFEVREQTLHPDSAEHRVYTSEFLPQPEKEVSP